MQKLKSYIKLMRPKHYLKNGLVFVPLFFNRYIFDWNLSLKTLLGFVAFSFMSSVVYIINDTDVYNKNAYLTDFTDQIYLTVLDVSFAHTGGCLAITSHDKFDEYRQAIENDLLDIELIDNDNDDNELKVQKNKIRQRKKVIKNLLENHPFSNTYKEFYNITRKLRQELLGLDGATIVNTNGKLLASGAIVSIDGGSENGGRTAATKQLAKYGFAIKISEDGYIQCYGYNEKNKKVENVLNFC